MAQHSRQAVRTRLRDCTSGSDRRGVGVVGLGGGEGEEGVRVLALILLLVGIVGGFIGIAYFHGSDVAFLFAVIAVACGFGLDLWIFSE